MSVNDTLSSVYSKRTLTSTTLESYRNLLLEKSCRAGVSRKKAEAGFTHDVCTELEKVRWETTTTTFDDYA